MPQVNITEGSQIDELHPPAPPAWSATTAPRTRPRSWSSTATRATTSPASAPFPRSAGVPRRRVRAASRRQFRPHSSSSRQPQRPDVLIPQPQLTASLRPHHRWSTYRIPPHATHAPTLSRLLPHCVPSVTSVSSSLPNSCHSCHSRHSWHSRHSRHSCHSCSFMPLVPLSVARSITFRCMFDYPPHYPRHNLLRPTVFLHNLLCPSTSSTPLLMLPARSLVPGVIKLVDRAQPRDDRYLFVACLITFCLFRVGPFRRDGRFCAMNGRLGQTTLSSATGLVAALCHARAGPLRIENRLGLVILVPSVCSIDL
jgi:hypothetical protein